MAQDKFKLDEAIALTGFFSEYLPPCFSLEKRHLNHPPGGKCDLIPPYSFTMSRYNGNDARRTIFLPEIGSYLAVYSFMKEHAILHELTEFTKCSSHSFSPFLDGDGNILYHDQEYSAPDEECTPKYIQNIAEKLKRSAGAKKILKLDISNCYASFYMHMLPAIPLGADEAERNYHLKGKGAVDPQYFKYSKLDEAVRRQNLSRTNGLLPGPLYSKILAEAILTRIDLELDERDLHFVRYVDDYEIFLYGEEERSVITTFSTVLKRYGFSLNAEKTAIVSFPFYVSENLDRLARGKLENPLTCEDMLCLFDTFLELESNGTKGAIRYLLKCLEQEKPSFPDPELYQAYLLTIMANNERSLPKACALLISFNETAALRPEHQKRIRKMLESHIAYGHDLEIIWLLYLLVETNCISQEDPILPKISDTDVELAHAILLRRDLLSGSLLTSVAARAKSWLLLYELYAADIISENDFVSRLGLHENLPMYQYFKAKKLHFVSPSSDTQLPF